MNDSIDKALDDLDDLDFNDSIVKVFNDSTIVKVFNHGYLPIVRQTI